jgi:imidazolonepropionase-like amidohydrolase
MTKNVFFLMAILLGLTGRAQKNSFLIENVVLHMPDKTIENGVLGVMGDSIVLAADSRVIKFDKRLYDTIYNGGGNHLWPGFISLNTVIGLTEIDAVRATRDFNETGEMNPHMRSLTSFNTDSRILPTLVNTGVLMVQSCPRGGLICGSSSVFSSLGWNWEDAALKADDGIHVNWPSLQSRRQASDTGDASKMSIIAQLQLDEFFAHSAAYCRNKKPEKKNLLYEAMRPVFEGQANVYFHASMQRDIRDALLFSAKHGIKKPVLVGAAECLPEAALIKQMNVPVILARLFRLPDLPDQSPVAIAELPAKLQEAGILTSLCYQGEMEAMGSRNLPFTAGNAIAYGLNELDAMNMISLNAAKILGIESDYGSLEPGKKASFFLCKGDALDMRGAGAIKVWVNGREQSADNHQKQLYRKFMNHYNLPLE